jgi:hypothetical protein
VTRRSGDAAADASAADASAERHATNDGSKTKRNRAKLGLFGYAVTRERGTSDVVTDDPRRDQGELGALGGRRRRARRGF